MNLFIIYFYLIIYLLNDVDSSSITCSGTTNICQDSGQIVQAFSNSPTTSIQPSGGEVNIQNVTTRDNFYMYGYKYPSIAQYYTSTAYSPGYGTGFITDFQEIFNVGEGSVISPDGKTIFLNNTGIYEINFHIGYTTPAYTTTYMYAAIFIVQNGLTSSAQTVHCMIDGAMRTHVAISHFVRYSTCYVKATSGDYLYVQIWNQLTGLPNFCGVSPGCTLTIRYKFPYD